MDETIVPASQAPFGGSSKQRRDFIKSYENGGHCLSVPGIGHCLNASSRPPPRAKSHSQLKKPRRVRTRIRLCDSGWRLLPAQCWLTV